MVSTQWRWTSPPRDGVARLHAASNGRPVEALLANAGHGLGGAFLDQEFDEVRHVIDTNVTGTLDLIQRIGRDMRARGRGRILITGSIAGHIPGTYNAVYNGTKALIDSFAFALRAELKDSRVTVTRLMPGATETGFFERAGMADTRAGQGKKDDPAVVARAGFDAMMKGEADVVTGWKNKVQTTLANVTPNTVLVEQHRRSAEPGSADPHGAEVGMNAIQFLEREHEHAKAEFAKVLEASPVQRGALWAALIPQLATHEDIEDACVYKPLARDAAAADPTLATWREHHQQEVSRVERLMGERRSIRRARSGGPRRRRYTRPSRRTFRRRRTPSSRGFGRSGMPTDWSARVTSCTR